MTRNTAALASTVLVVDDSLTVRMDLADAFSQAGFATVECATLAEARAALASQAVDVVVLDVQLPDGDGIELLSEIRADARTAALPVLMLSMEAEVRDRVRGLRTGADEYVGKPYDTTYVVARAHDLVRAPLQPRDGGRRSVLVIDDSPTSRAELVEGLEAAGYDVLAARSGEEGLRIAASARPDAIIVDGVLPGIDGATVIRRVRLDAALRGVACLLITAADDRGGELRALDAGADAFVRKDHSVDIVLARLAATLRAPVAVAAAPVASLLGPKKILFVDDSPTFLHQMADALRGEGYDVVLARSGAEALELLAVQAVDCILLDRQMPGMSGDEVCQLIKAAPVLRDVPLILLTASDGHAAMLSGLACGADDYITKSSELDVLKARVRAQLRRKQFEDENRRMRDELLRRELDAAEARAARELAETRAELLADIEAKNRELEAFSYSVSHDLRAPLRAISGFSDELLVSHGEKLPARGRFYLERIHANSERMTHLIDDLLKLASITRQELVIRRCDLAALARAVFDELRSRNPERLVEVSVPESLPVVGDSGLLRIVLENLLGNAWKFSSKNPDARIEVGARGGDPVEYFVSDNGDGFDMAFAGKLFAPFQRLHHASEFEGTGIGLSTIQRIVHRHGGRVWAEAQRGRGATFFFTLPSRAEPREGRRA